MTAINEKTIAQHPKTPSMADVDGDIHPTLKPMQIAERLRSPEHRDLYLRHGHRIPSPPEVTPRVRNGGQRLDSRPDDGPPGSSLEMMQDQLLDEFGINNGILIPLQAHTMGVGEPEFTSDLCQAINEGVSELF